MRRWRLELGLVGILGLALVALLVFRPAPDEGRGPLLDLAVPGPCGPAMGEVAEIRPPAEPDIASVAAVVEQLRELRFDEVPAATYLPSDGFRTRIEENFDYPEEEADLDRRALTLLGAIPEDYDLRAELESLAGEHVLGFYDPETEDLVVRTRAEGDSLTADEVLTLAHELEHALADQALGLPDLGALLEEDVEAASAARALVEGDAMVITQLYASVGLSFAEQFTLLLQVPGVAALDSTPHFVLRSLSFPYAEGTDFVCALYRAGGWTAVDDAYADLPATTAEILFPERYLAGEEARDPDLPAGLPEPWGPASSQPLGAADLLFLFEAPGGHADRGLEAPQERAAAWDGGAIHTWTSGEDTAVAVLLVQREGASDLCATMAEWYRDAFGPAAAWQAETPSLRTAAHDGRAAALRCEDGEVHLGIGPDRETAVAASS